MCVLCLLNMNMVDKTQTACGCVLALQLAVSVVKVNTDMIFDHGVKAVCANKAGRVHEWINYT